MNFIENIREAFRSIASNTLRAVLTALIIAIGITALVGILTAIDGIQASADSSLSGLGANSFDITRKGLKLQRRRHGLTDVKYPDITFREAKSFREKFFWGSAKVSVSTDVAQAAEAKAGSKQTNPNCELIGADDNYLANNGYNLREGRNFSTNELRYGTFVAIIGGEVADKLFNQNPIGKMISVFGNHFMVIGIIEQTGGVMGGNGSDRAIVVPLERATNLTSDRKLTFDIKTSVSNPAELEGAMSEATGLMRLIRHDRLGTADSFELSRSESLGESLDSITGSLRMAGFVIGFITLLGAAIGLMNIMMVSVTERTREIGIRKALGATPALIRQQFLIEAITICQLGGLGGIILGISIGNLVSSGVGSVGFIIPWVWILLGLGVCVFVGIVSGYYPAWKASKLDPIDSLRFE